ncbi:MAG TPA: crossover junction endodeoxyribonuclease RuvC, partial [Saprospiraceae bacterium]|nr:crossover junction endodeoxyribonuclease RuvC [Saprospiraceae bacterium]
MPVAAPKKIAAMPGEPPPPTGVRILGIDPGTNVLGFAVLDADKRSGMKVIEIGVVTFQHVGEEHTVKLRYIFEQVQDLIRQYGP